MLYKTQSKRWQRIREWALYTLMTPVRKLFQFAMARRNLVLIYCVMGNGLGDALTIASILGGLNRQAGTKGIVFSMSPALFESNPRVVSNLSYHAMPSWKRSLFKMLLRSLRGPAVLCVGGEVWTVGTNPLDTRDLVKRREKGWNWLEKLLPDYRPALDYTKLKPEIFFSHAEVANFQQKFAQLPRPFALLKATVGFNRPTGAYLKNWDTTKLAWLVAQTSQANWVQIGESGEDQIQGCLDLRGKTSLREIMWLVSQAKFMLSVEGFITHLGAAFNIPTITPLTGAYDPQTFIYKNTIPLLADPMPSCSPCWLDKCQQETMICRDNIKIKKALLAIRNELAKDKRVD
jgi:hypothetical protein